MGDDGGLSGSAQTLTRLFSRADGWLNRNIQELAAEIPGGRQHLSQFEVSSRSLLLALVMLLLVWIVPPLVLRLLRRGGWVAANFKGEKIPRSFGIALVACAAPALILDALTDTESVRSRTLWLITISGFFVLGLIDDLWGDHSASGLRGHLRALITERRLTTGLVKAVGGIVIAAHAGVQLNPGAPWRAAVATGVIALAANAINLLDLRPGRACAAFCAANIAALFGMVRLGRLAPVVPDLTLLVPALVIWPTDGAARAMLGDAGSNTLGAALGLAICSGLPFAWQVAALLLLAAINLLAERVSISRIIEQAPLLRALDRLTGER